MRFTGNSLRRVHNALVRAISDIEMDLGQIQDFDGSCGEEIEELQGEQLTYQRLLQRVQRSIEKESQ